MSHTARGQDVVELLPAQHDRIRELFDDLDHTSGDRRRDVFRELVPLLAVHETAEEEILHPAARETKGGDAVVDVRVGEERRAKELLSTLDDMGPDAEGFDTLLVQLRDDVLAHADPGVKGLWRTWCSARRSRSWTGPVTLIRVALGR